MKKIIKKLIKSKIKKVPFFGDYFSGMATILTLHRVYPIDKNRLSCNEGLKISPEFLEKFIIDCRSKGYDFISLDELFLILKNKQKVKKKIIFTIDDGYKDNYTHAYPVFKKYKVPFTIYLTTSFPEGSAVLWWYILEDLILEKDQIKLNNGEFFECGDINSKKNAFDKIRGIILKLDQDDLFNQLKNLFFKYKLDWYKYNKELCMNWSEIITLSKDDLVNIGGHTLNHYALNRLNQKNLIKEIMEANKLIESKVGKKVEHFAFPFGCINTTNIREVAAVRKLRLKTATTTRRGLITLKHREYMCSLPRVKLSEGKNIEELDIINPFVKISEL